MHRNLLTITLLLTLSLALANTPIVYYYYPQIIVQQPAVVLPPIIVPPQPANVESVRIIIPAVRLELQPVQQQQGATPQPMQPTARPQVPAAQPILQPLPSARAQPQTPAVQPMAPPAITGCVDINTASFDELRQIIHIDADRAGQIQRLRPFNSIDSLVQVSGIAAARLADIQAQGLACVR